MWMGALLSSGSNVGVEIDEILWFSEDIRKFWIRGVAFVKRLT